MEASSPSGRITTSVLLSFGGGAGVSEPAASSFHSQLAAVAAEGTKSAVAVP